MSNFIPFRTYTDSESARPLVEALTAAGVAVQVDDTRRLFSGVLQQMPTFPEVRVLVPAAELARAQALLAAQAPAAADMPADHYLHQFSDAELLDLVTKPDEWSAHDYVWAQQLLTDRGRVLRPAELQALRQVRDEQLATYQKLATGWLVAGWVFAVLGGPLGIAIGWNFYASRTSLPDGRRVPTYAPADQSQDKWIMGVGSLMTGLGLVLRLLE